MRIAVLGKSLYFSKLSRLELVFVVLVFKDIIFFIFYMQECLL